MKMTLLCPRLVTAGCLLLAAGCSRLEPANQAGATSSAPATVTFNAQIQPILSENCYHCHGPDSGSRKGGLRLDVPEIARKGGDSGKPALVPGDPEHSMVMRRILSQDPQEVMPPPAMHSQLKPPQVELVRQWIRQGAVYEPHWAFIAPQRPVEPVVGRKDWPHNAIDRFILARLEKEGLNPSLEADRTSLIRRVTYDLTGLPPTPEEVAAFLADAMPDAYERVVDRLLASPRYGEHRARYWLDVARYGDSHGLHADTERTVWPYRDYVIRSFNANKPFDQFTRENIAGDMLPARNLDQKLASAFVRLGVSTGEGGAIHQEVRVNNARERVEAFGAAYLGLTTGCAACHDHKFDPLSQKDHYQLAAFFNNLTESPVNGEKTNWPPYVTLPKPEKLNEYNELLAARASIAGQLAARRAQAAELVAAWLKSGRHPAVPVSLDALDVRLKLNEAKGEVLSNSAPHAADARVTTTGVAPVWGEDTWLWPSLRLETTTRLELPRTGDLDVSDAFSLGAWVKPLLERTKGEKLEGTVWSRRAAVTDAPGWEVRFDEGCVEVGLFGGRPDNAAVIRSEAKVLESGHWTHLLATCDGTGKAAGLHLFVDGEPSRTTVIRDNLNGSIRTNAPLLFSRRHPDGTPLRQTSYQDFRFYRRSLTPDEVRRVPGEDYVGELAARPMTQWNEDEFHAVADFYFRARDEEAPAWTAKIAEYDARLEQLAGDGVTAMVSEESPRLAYADVLNRGVYSQRKERVRPAIPHFLPQLPPGAPRDRRGLAEWIVGDKNPLTARVTVNRMWAELFGTGIVETTEDFGVVGARPSHQELLDWLAVDFRESGWNVKRFYKQLVMSATYRQSARVEPAALEKDPRNRLLARGPRFRMDAEMLRDTVLATSGLLVEKIGGPPVKPYQPAGIWEAVAIPEKNTSNYVQDHGEALYRRSLYTFWKRMSPMPDISTFDAPDRDISCTRRQRTNTPLQALVTLNDPLWLEGARHLAEELVRSAGSDDERLRRLAQLMLARNWSERERQLIRKSLVEFRAEYSPGGENAGKLLQAGESPRDATLSAPEVAAWMLLVNSVQNLDVTLNK